MDFQTKRRYAGHLDQLFSVRETRMDGGPAHGSKLIEIDNGAGVQAIILPDRGMDIYQVRFAGLNLNYLTPTGLVNASDYSGDRFLERFFAGFLTTCGLENIGTGCQDEGVSLPLHGSYSTLKADRLSVDLREEGTKDGAPEAVIRGTMNHQTLFGRKLSLTREFTFRYGEQGFSFVDTVKNHGDKPVPLMLLYHFNMGYPLLSEAAKLYIPSTGVRPRNQQADLSLWQVIDSPQPGRSEMCFHHTMKAQADGRAHYGIDNPECGISLRIAYDPAVLDHFVQWRMLGDREYVMGLEPCNATIEGRDLAREDGTLKMIQPGETISYPFTITLSRI